MDKFDDARRSAEKTGLISGVVILGLLLIGDVLLVVRNMNAGRSVGMFTWISMVGLVVMIIAVTVRGRQRLRRAAPPVLDESDPA